MSINLNKSYRATLCKLTGISDEQFEYYSKLAFARLNCDPREVALIAKTMKYMAKKHEFEPRDVKPTKPVSRRGNQSPRRFTPSEAEDINRRYANKELLKDIAEIHKASMASISNLAKRSGLPRRK